MKIQKLFCTKTMKDYYQVSGAGPKRIVIVEHEVRFVAIEVKRPGGKPSKLQLAQLNRIQASGGVAMIAESVDDVIAHLSNADITLG